MKILHGNKSLDLSIPQVMGILNVTPDSFSDGGRFNQIEAALHQAHKMVNDGASIIDIGGESTRPGAALVTAQEELSRVIPVIKAIRREFDVWISIDTSKAIVMQEAVNAGANLINDVRALTQENALTVAAQCDVPVCLMHMQGQPQSMQDSPSYQDFLNEIKTFFNQRLVACRQAGIKDEHIILDPGFGFGKTMANNFSLIKHFNEFSSYGFPLLAGLSRKSMFDHLLGLKIDERLASSLTGALLCAQQGASIIRVHDVKETADMLKILSTVSSAP
jgi:dihydropteroate synthase